MAIGAVSHLALLERVMSLPPKLTPIAVPPNATAADTAIVAGANAVLSAVNALIEHLQGVPSPQPEPDTPPAPALTILFPRGRPPFVVGDVVDVLAVPKSGVTWSVSPGTGARITAHHAPTRYDATHGPGDLAALHLSAPGVYTLTVTAPRMTSAIVPVAVLAGSPGPAPDPVPMPLPLPPSSERPDPAWGAPAFFDDFDGTSLDVTKWTAEERDAEPQAFGFMNGILAYRRRNVTVRDSKVILRAMREADPSGLPFTAGAISTYTKRSFLYGRTAVRAKLPGGQGMHSAVWMTSDRPYERTHGINNYEVDFAEYVGQWPRIMHHAQLLNPDQQPDGSNPPPEAGPAAQSDDGIDWSQDFHVYECEWTPTELIYRIDGRERLRVDRSARDRVLGMPFVPDVPMCLHANIQIGEDHRDYSDGSWPGRTDATTFAEGPRTLEIDWWGIWPIDGQPVPAPSPTPQPLPTPTPSPTPGPGPGGSLEPANPRQRIAHPLRDGELVPPGWGLAGDERGRPWLPMRVKDHRLTITYPKGFRETHPQGTPWSLGPGKLFWEPVDFTEWVFMRLVVGVSRNWKQNASQTHKLVEAFLQTNGRTLALLFGGGADGRGALQPHVTGRDDTPYRDRSGEPFTRGVMHDYQILTRLNSAPGVPDGSITYALNGRATTYTGIALVRAGEVKRVTSLALDAIWGGLGWDLPEDQELWIDDLYFSGR